MISLSEPHGLDGGRPRPCRVLRCKLDAEGRGPVCQACWTKVPDERRASYRAAAKAAYKAKGSDRMPAMKTLWKEEDDLVNGILFVLGFLDAP